MGEVAMPSGLPDEIIDIKRRLKILETAAPMRNTSMKEGTFLVTDENDEPMVLVGRFLDGSYGLGLLDGSGNFVSLQNYVFGQRFGQEIPTDSTDSTSYVDLGGPSVTVEVGPTGNVLVTAGAYIGIDATQTGIVGLFLDGALLFGGAIISLSNGNAAGIAASVANSRLITTLDPGPHTFELRYRVGSGPPANFSSRTLLVQPI